MLWARREARLAGDAKLDGILTRLITYNEQSKLYSTYYKRWTEAIDFDGRVRCVYSLGRTSTGRLSSYGENLQNIGEIVRELVVPSAGYDLLVQADVRALEMGMAAHISRDRRMRTWIRDGKDIHAMMAARVLGLTEPKTKAEVSAFKKAHNAERQIGKKSNFATLFHVTADTLAWQIFEESNGEAWIPPEEVQKYIDMFFVLYPGYKEYIDELWRALIRREWIVSPFGRRWLLPATQAGWRKAQNYPIQSSGSDLVLLMLRAIDRELRRGRWKSRIIGEVHDSLLFETTTKEFRPLEDLLHQCCENPDTSGFGFAMSVPTRIEIKAGPSWGALQEV